MTVQWKQPPPSTAGKWRNDLTPIVTELRSRPGEWALVYEGRSASNATGVKRGNGLWAPAGAFEATTRKRDDGSADVYVRFVGEPS